MGALAGTGITLTALDMPPIGYMPQPVEEYDSYRLHLVTDRLHATDAEMDRLQCSKLASEGSNPSGGTRGSPSVVDTETSGPAVVESSPPGNN